MPFPDILKLFGYLSNASIQTVSSTHTSHVSLTSLSYFSGQQTRLLLSHLVYFRGRAVMEVICVALLLRFYWRSLWHCYQLCCLLLIIFAILIVRFFARHACVRIFSGEPPDTPARLWGGVLLMKSLKVINKIAYQEKILFSQGKQVHNNKPL